MFQFVSVFASKNGGDMYLFQLEGMSQVYDSLSNLAKGELVAMWNMGDQEAVVKFLRVVKFLWRWTKWRRLGLCSHRFCI